MITADQLRKLLHYNPDTGVFTRLVGTGKGAAVGSEAGTINKAGYRIISLKSKAYMAHRLAFLYMLGQWPSKFVDHVDRNKGNNRWVNLREADKTQNAGNVTAHKDNKLGVKGVTKNGSGYKANIYLDGKQTHLGTFKSKEEAAAAYVVAAQKKFKEFAST